MIVYRINVELGYRNIILEFPTCEEAGAFASNFLTHIKAVEDNKKVKLSMDIVDTEAESLEDEEDE